VRVGSEDGEILAEALLEAAGGLQMDAHMALLGSPTGADLLAAWSESSAFNNNDRFVRVARLVCLDQ
jgi:hypothetical protein